LEEGHGTVKVLMTSYVREISAFKKLHWINVGNLASSMFRTTKCTDGVCVWEVVICRKPVNVSLEIILKN